MIEPRPSIARFVRAVASAELARGGSEPGGDVAQRLVAQLYRKLAKLIGRDGFEVLLARSLVLAQRAHPVLARVTVASGAKLAGLDEVARVMGDDAEFRHGTIAIVAQFVELIATLIGEDLAMRLVREAWPAAPEEQT